MTKRFWIGAAPALPVYRRGNGAWDDSLGSVLIIWFTDGGETHIAAAISDSAGGQP